MVGKRIGAACKASPLAWELAQAQEPAEPAPVGEVVVGMSNHGERARSTKLVFQLTTLSTSSGSSQQSPRCSRKEAKWAHAWGVEEQEEEEGEEEEREGEEAVLEEEEAVLEGEEVVLEGEEEV